MLKKYNKIRENNNPQNGNNNDIKDIINTEKIVNKEEPQGLAYVHEMFFCDKSVFNKTSKEI